MVVMWCNIVGVKLEQNSWTSDLVGQAAFPFLFQNSAVRWDRADNEKIFNATRE